VAELPAVRLEEEPIVPAQSRSRVAVVPSNGGFDAAGIARWFAGLRAQQADIVVYGGMRGPEGWQVELPVLEQAVRAEGGALAVAVATAGCDQRQSVALVTPEGTHEHVATHGRGTTTGETNASVIATPWGNIGLLCGDEGFVAEVARCLALEGADLLLWPLFAPAPMVERVVRTRADESRVYVAAAWPDGGLVASPDGAILTAAPAGTGVAMAAPVNLAFSRWKERAPGTNVIRDRLPEAYGELTR
jgi:hypothetical protein